MPLGAGKTTVAKGGTPVPLAETTRVESVTITALSTNTQPVYIGGSEVSAANKIGTPLVAGGEPVKYNAAIDHVDDLAQISVDSLVNGEGVSFSYGHRP